MGIPRLPRPAPYTIANGYQVQLWIAVGESRGYRPVVASSQRIAAIINYLHLNADRFEQADLEVLLQACRLR